MWIRRCRLLPRRVIDLFISRMRRPICSRLPAGIAHFGSLTDAREHRLNEKDRVPKKENQAQEKPRETTVEFLASLAAVLVTGLFIITFVLQAFEIPSSSMENTLLIGDHVFVNRVLFAPATHWMGPLLPYREIRRQDIVVFLSPAQPGLFVIKRIIRIPG